MRWIVARPLFMALSALLALALAPFPALAQSASRITEGENTRLMHGETIRRVQSMDRDGRHYVGGVTYTVLDATPHELDTVFNDVPSYETILPHTKSARVVARIDDDVLVELHQGNALVDATYTIRLRKDPNGREVRFWLDGARHHDIEDAWGFFRVEPLAQVVPGVPRVLVTYGILVDVGPGIVRTLFESKIRDSMLTVPQRLRRYMLTLRGAPRAPRSAPPAAALR
jgi:hypothetical protein